MQIGQQWNAMNVGYFFGFLNPEVETTHTLELDFQLSSSTTLPCPEGIPSS